MNKNQHSERYEIWKEMKTTNDADLVGNAFTLIPISLKGDSNHIKYRILLKSFTVKKSISPFWNKSAFLLDTIITIFIQAPLFSVVA